jgi:hypothetical protein
MDLCCSPCGENRGVDICVCRDLAYIKWSAWVWFSVSAVLHTAGDEQPLNKQDALREQLLVRGTHARRSTEVNRIRNQARAEDDVIPRQVV